MNINLLLSLSEGDKRFLIAVLLIVILLFVLIYFIGKLVIRVMKYQGQKLDEQVSDAVKLKVIKNRKHFVKYSNSKNWRIFFKSVWIPLCIIAFAFLILVIRNAINNDWGYNPFNFKDGFGSLSFIWDFDNAEWTEVFPLPFKLLKAWPELLCGPCPNGAAWASYIFVPCIFIGGIWYLLLLQAVVARWIRTKQLAKSIYSPKLDEYHNDSQINNNNIEPPTI